MPCITKPLRARRLTLIASLFGAGLAFASTAQAQAVTDAVGDFIPSYTGPKGADLDVIAMQATYNGATFRLDATTNGVIGQTAGGVYVWGFNRGQGTARFGAIASNVLFDSVIIVDPKGVTTVRDLITGTATVLPAGAVTVSGNKLSVVMPASLLTPQGLKTAQFLSNLWPRSGLVGNQTISDFAPDNGDARVVLAFPTPEEASAQTEVVIDGASARFDQIQSRLGGRRESEARFSGFLTAGTRFGDHGLGDSLTGDQTTTIASGGVDYAVTPDLIIGATLSLCA